MSTIKQFSIGGAVGIAIGLIATAIQWKYPDYKSLANVLLVIGGLIIFTVIVAAIVRAFTIREYERLHSHASVSVLPTPAQNLTQTASPHNEFNPHSDYNPQNVFNPNIAVHVPVSQSQNVPVKSKVTRDPVFESRGTRFRRYGLNFQTGELIREEYKGDPSQVYDHIRFVETALARFLYRADLDVDPRLRVNAHIFVHEIHVAMALMSSERAAEFLRAFSSKPSGEVYKPIWDGDEPHVSIEFSAGYTHELVIALVPAEENPTGIMGYEYGSKRISSYMGNEQVFSPEIHSIPGKDFLIKIELIPKLWNDVRCKLPAYWFRLVLSRTPPIFEFIVAVESTA